MEFPTISPMAPPSTSDGGAPSTHRFLFHGDGGDFFALYLINLLKKIVTLGIYTFWAKTKVRQYIWGHTEFAGDRFGYHGTGKELLIGWLKAIAVFGGLFLLLTLATAKLGNEPAKLIAMGSFYIIMLLLFPLAIVGMLRYRLSRTSWRGIRFSFRGKYQVLLATMAKGILLSALTLGLYLPYYQTAMRRFVVEHTYFGSRTFTFDGNGQALFGKYLISILLTLPTLGLIWVWYSAQQRRYFWNQTTALQARFQSTVAFGNLCVLIVTNILFVIFTFGLAMPWVMIRTLRYDLQHLTLEGPLNLEAITQEAMAVPAVGEELGSILDIDSLAG